MIDTFLQNEGADGITMFTPRDVRVEISRAPALQSHRDELVRGARCRQVLMLVRQRMIKAVSDMLEHRHIEGLGRKIATIDPDIYAQMELQYGQGCWRDKDFLADTLEKNPHLRVRCEPGKTTVLVNGLGGRRPEVGSRKSEGEQGCAGRAEGSTSNSHRSECATAVGAPLFSKAEIPDVRILEATR